MMMEKYTPFYCEENIYWLLNSGQRENARAILYAVFISNPEKQILMWHQRSSSSTSSDNAVIWDYHVIALSFPSRSCEKSREGEDSVIYDLDTTLFPFPCPSRNYVDLAFRELPSEFPKRYFRVIPAELFLYHFGSNRSHMLTQDGRYHAPPPKYPCIRSISGCDNSLPFYLSMTEVCESKDSDGVKWLFSTKTTRNFENDAFTEGAAGASSYPHGVVLTEELFREFLK